MKHNINKTKTNKGLLCPQQVWGIKKSIDKEARKITLGNANNFILLNFNPFFLVSKTKIEKDNRKLTKIDISINKNHIFIFINNSYI